jgi:hypothetical protein
MDVLMKDTAAILLLARHVNASMQPGVDGNSRSQSPMRHPKGGNMRLHTVALFCMLAGAVAASAAQQRQQAPVNPAIDMEGFLRVSAIAAKHRESRRLSQEEFARMSREPGTVVLDARSKDRYDQLHVKGAIHLSFPDIAIDSLRKTIPDRKTRILIYCNNNFLGAEGPFPSKLPSASLNLSTYIALYNYGYRNVYELGDTLDIKESKLEFASAATAR